MGVEAEASVAKRHQDSPSAFSSVPNMQVWRQQASAVVDPAQLGLEGVLELRLGSSLVQHQLTECAVCRVYKRPGVTIYVWCPATRHSTCARCAQLYHVADRSRCSVHS